MGIVISRTSKPKKHESNKQYTKKLYDRLIFLITVTVIVGLYINYKNGFSVNEIVTSLLEALKYSVPSYCFKSLFETKSEKNMDLEFKKLELEFKRLEIELQKSTKKENRDND